MTKAGLTWADLLTHWARVKGSTPAIVMLDKDGNEAKRLTFSELHSMSDNVAHHLDSQGMRSGNRVAVSVDNPILASILLAAFDKNGCGFLVVDSALPDVQARQLCADLGTEHIFVDPDRATSRGTVDVASFIDSAAHQAYSAYANYQLTATAFVTTGGTTGRPKIVRATAPPPPSVDVVLQAFSTFGIFPDQRQVLAGLLSQSFTQVWASAGLGCGQTLLALDPEAKPMLWPERFITAIGPHQPEVLACTPSLMTRLMHALQRDSGLEFPRLTTLLHAGAPCPLPTKRFWIELLGAEHVYEYYGATELAGLTMIRGDAWMEHPGSVGRPTDFQAVIAGRDSSPAVRIVDDNLNDVPARELGRVFLYSGAEQQTRESISGADKVEVTADGYASVGDLGYLDEDGYLYLSGRPEEMIISSATNVFLGAVERVLMTHPAVADAGTFGIDDPLTGQAVAAFIELKEGEKCAASELVAYCRTHLTFAEIPRVMKFVPRIKRSTRGKISQEALRSQYDEILNGQDREMSEETTFTF